MKKVLASSMENSVGDAVVAGKHGAPLISDAKLLQLHATLLRATGAARKSGNASARKDSAATRATVVAPAAATIKFPAIYASLLADLTPADRIAADIPLHLTPFGLGSPLDLSPAMATGLAIGLAQNQPNSLVIAFTRANRLALDAFRHTLRTAARHHAPILYVLLPATTAPSALDWSASAIREDVPCIPVDAHDAVAIYRIAQETILRARNQGGPSLIDCKQVQLVRGDSNPVTRMEAHLRRKGLTSAALKHASGNPLSSTSRLANSPA